MINPSWVTVFNLINFTTELSSCVRLHSSCSCFGNIPINMYTTWIRPGNRKAVIYIYVKGETKEGSRDWYRYITIKSTWTASMSAAADLAENRRGRVKVWTSRSKNKKKRDWEWEKEKEKILEDCLMRGIEDFQL